MTDPTTMYTADCVREEVEMPRKGERMRHFLGIHEADYTAEELDFMRAMEDFKRTTNRLFPTWAEVLGVLKALGYRKIAPAVPPPASPP